MAKKTAKPQALESLTFEQAFEELEATVQQLESGDLPLEESLKLFERGQALAAYCGRLLDEAEVMLEQLTPADE
jgi:exodeoxyribonuclease VII small subunit